MYGNHLRLKERATLPRRYAAILNACHAEDIKCTTVSHICIAVISPDMRVSQTD